jgi:hypothetical protein
MAAGQRKRSTKKGGKRKGPSPQAKAAATREAEALARKRSAAAKRGAETKRRRAEERAALARAAKRADKLRRSKAAKKGQKTRRARARAVLALTTMLDVAARGNKASDWARIKPEWLDAKWELFDAVDSDRERYLDILESIAEETDCDWQIAYGPEPEG